MKNVYATLLCITVCMSHLHAEKFLATINELPGYVVSGGKAKTNYVPDILSESQHGYIVPLEVESIIETDARVEKDNLFFLFENEPFDQKTVKEDGRSYEYMMVIGGWGGKTHALRFANKWDAWLKGMREFSIVDRDDDDPMTMTTYRCHNNVPEQAISVSQFNQGPVFRLAIETSWRYARGKSARFDLHQLPYLCFSTWRKKIDFNKVRILSFIEV